MHPQSASRTGVLSKNAALLGGLAGLILTLYVGAGALEFGGQGLHVVLRDWVVAALYAAAAGACTLRAARRVEDRLAWSLMAAGAAAYGLATLVFVVTGDPGDVTGASAASHLGWLAFYPLVYTALLLLLAARVGSLPRSLWLDGAIGALGLAACLAAVGVPGRVEAAFHGTAVVHVWLAYPAGDVLLLATCLWAVSLSSWRPGRMWLVLAASFAVFTVGDLIRIRAVVTEIGFEPGLLVSVGYPLAMLLLGAAAWQPRPERGTVRLTDPRVVAFPAACAVGAFALLVVDWRWELHDVARSLAFMALAVAGVRAGITILEVGRLYLSRRFERGFEHAPIGMALLDRDLRWLRVNTALCRMLGRPASELVGRSVLEHMQPEARKLFSRRLRDAGSRSHAGPYEVRYLRPDGAGVDAQLTSVYVEDDAGDVGYYSAQIQDVTAHRQSEREKAAISELGHLALETAEINRLLDRAVGTVARTLATEHCMIARAASPGGPLRIAASARRSIAWKTILAAGTGSQSGYTLLRDEPVIANDLAAEDRFVVPEVSQEHGLWRGISVPIRQRSGSSCVLIAHEPARDRRFGDNDVHFLEAVAHVLASALDRDAAEAEMRRRALEDPLTRLPNRTLLGTQIEQALALAARHRTPVAVMLIDLDRFKMINETVGHGAGDELLATVAGRLRDVVRREDIVARLGGDEFVVVCSGEEADLRVGLLAQRLLDELARPIEAGGHAAFVTASVGVAVAFDGHSSAAELLRDADVAMYRAKERGGARFEVFDAALRARLLERHSVESALRGAVERGELRLHHQPIVDLDTGVASGYEALLRWQHPERGLLMPDSFICVAEETRQIAALGRWALHAACAELAEHDRGATRVWVNLSPSELGPELVEDVEAALAAAGLPAERLGLEITERLLIESAGAADVLAHLQGLGVALALDDFGTGYSSLAYLQRYPLDVLKLDRSFTLEVRQPRPAAIARAAVEMAGALGLRVIAEGVEEPAQRDRLRAMGCRFQQGYLFARPQPAADAMAFAGNGSS